MKNLKFSPEKVRVMIVDDQDTIRKAMKKIVLSIGIKDIKECSDGEEAIKELERTPYDLVICDLCMRKIQGIEVLHAIRSRHVASDIPFIVVTGEAAKEDIVKTSDEGANGYILKPFQANLFEEKVIAVLNAFHSPSELLKILRDSEKLILEKEYKESIVLLKSALEIDPLSVRAKHSLAIAYALSNKEDAALKLIEENIKQSSTYYRNYATLGNINLKYKKIPEAIAAITRELELHPKQPKRQTQLASILIKQGDFFSAIEHLREALKDNPKFQPALMGMGKAFAESGDLDKALYYYKRIRRYHLESTKALTQAVKACLQANEPRKAEVFLKDEKTMHKDRLDTHIVLAKFYITTDCDEKAIEVLDEIFKKNEYDTDALKVFGTLQMKLGRYDKAIEAFKKLTNVEPSVDAFVALAECMQKIGKHKTSIETLKKALPLDPNHPKLLFLMANSLLRTKQFSKANIMFYRAITVGWNNPNSKNLMNECQANLQLRVRARKPIAS